MPEISSHRSTLAQYKQRHFTTACGMDRGHFKAGRRVILPRSAKRHHICVVGRNIQGTKTHNDDRRGTRVHGNGCRVKNALWYIWCATNSRDITCVVKLFATKTSTRGLPPRKYTMTMDAVPGYTATDSGGKGRFGAYGVSQTRDVLHA